MALPPAPVEPVVARKTWRTLEPLHSLVYFVPEAAGAYAAVGVANDRMGYFGSRSAAMGAVTADVVVATFFNFAPDVVRRAVPAVWELAAPGRLLEARLRAADAALRRVLGDRVADPDVAEAASLARLAAETAAGHPEGRPLFAAHAALPWPDEPHLQLWHAQTLLREFRGDGHVAALTCEGLSAVEALVVHAASGEVPGEVLRRTRGWSEEAWQEGVERVRARGWLDDGDELVLSTAGSASRQIVEDRTDELAAVAYAPLGDEGCERLRALCRPMSRAVVDNGLLDVMRSPGLDAG